MSYQEKTRKVTSKISVTISAVSNKHDLEKPLYAVNWLNLKISWLYELYGILSVVHVIKVGGKPLFKGRIKERLEGDISYDRKILLIVGFPRADSFLKMVSNKLFQMKSILRLQAVKDFVFGFVKRMDDGPQPKFTIAYHGGKTYLVHVLQDLNKDEKLFDNAIHNLQIKGVSLFFSGQKAAMIGQQKNGEELINNPFFVEHILVWEGENISQLKDFISTKAYIQLKLLSGKNNLYIFDRLV